MSMQARAVETRRAIIRAAADAFVEHGFSGASLADIALRAGVTKGALYFHFPSKSALASAMILAQQDANAQLQEYVEAYDGDFLELLVRMTTQLGEQLVADSTLRAAMRLAVELGDTEDLRISDTYQIWERVVVRVAQLAKDRGELIDSVDPQQLARFLVASFTGMQTVSLVASGMDDLGARVDEMWRLLRPALAPTKRGSSG